MANPNAAEQDALAAQFSQITGTPLRQVRANCVTTCVHPLTTL
jgi:hypothetical protein